MPRVRRPMQKMFVCSRPATRENAPRCACGRRATKLCDFPVATGDTGTCDAPLCSKCAVQIGTTVLRPEPDPVLQQMARGGYVDEDGQPFRFASEDTVDFCPTHARPA